MLITRGACAAALPPVALTIGNFDGVHKGHQAILDRLCRAAAARSLVACVLTFEPHPREFFAPEAAPTRLTSLREKIELLTTLGMDRVHIQHFSGAFAKLSPEQFVADIMVRGLRTRSVLVGEDFRFGARRAGDLALLRELGAAGGFEVRVMPTVVHHEARVSSSAVRDALAAGDLERAEALHGRPYSISGRVVHGSRLGSSIGCPTANIMLQHNRPPLLGIYAVLAHLEGGEGRPGVASLGFRPTVDSLGQPVLEVHLFDFSGDLYGRHVRVEFLKKLRDEARFPDLETLKAQIQRDCEAARQVLMETRND